ncbi:MAG: 1,4-alpha-glucan branching protein domain-containing protein, partial [Terriglobales bacterium]
LNISPVLAEQWAHPVFRAEFPGYLRQKIEAARLDRQEFADGQEDPRLLETAAFWEGFYTGALGRWESASGDLIAAFRRHYERGALEIITCGATHGYFPLLGTDAAIRAQVSTAVATHRRHFGRAPRGIWLPECAYRPRGMWTPPVGASLVGAGASFLRAGVEEILQANGIEFFVVDTHLVERHIRFSPYTTAGDAPVQLEAEITARPSLYRPALVDTPGVAVSSVSAFPRDPRTGLQVWSGDHGYPGDGVYLDFHKKRWPGGLRYWQVTHPRIDLGKKTLYYPDRAEQRAREHARHFAKLCAAVLDFNLPAAASGVDHRPPVLTAPFDAELFGHWWFEGPHWLQHVAETLASPESPVEMTSATRYLDRYPSQDGIQLPEGSWGSGGGHQVWLNPETAFTWEKIYPAERRLQALVAHPRLASDEGARLLRQLCREMLLLESSDWQFLITTQHARDYAEQRFAEHERDFNLLAGACEALTAGAPVPAGEMAAIEAVEKRDGLFPDIQPSAWRAG